MYLLTVYVYVVSVTALCESCIQLTTITENESSSSLRKTLNCSLTSPCRISGIFTLMSIEISKFSVSALLVSLDFTNGIVTTSAGDELRLEASGEIDTLGYLSIDFIKLPNSEVSDYLCTVRGQDEGGRSNVVRQFFSIESSTCYETRSPEVTPSEINVSPTSQETQDCQAILSEADALRQQLNQSHDKVLELIKPVNLNDKVIMEYLFHDPLEWGKSKYFLSNVSTISESANVICARIGGYLAEVNDQEEFLQVQNYVKIFNDANVILIGGTDVAEEGTWTFQHSGEPVTYLNWNSGEPNDAFNNEDCIGLERWANLTMNDIPCNNARSDSRWLCEVPVLKSNSNRAYG